MLVGVIVDIGYGDLILYGVPFAIIVGWFSGRILGVRRGWWRAFLAGLAGWLVGVILSAVLTNDDIRTGGDLLDNFYLIVFFGVLVSMFISLVLDIILQPKMRKRRRLGPLLHPIASVQRKFSPLGRSREIIGFARHRGLTKVRGLSMAKLATPEYARRIRLMLEDCGGMFVKFGQIASTRGDLLPEVLTDELATLQSSARTVAADDVRAVVEGELHASIEEEFASFDFEPLAAASIGQTHRAVLKSGEHVVIKVQRPGVEDIVKRDAAVLRFIAAQLERRVDGARQIGVRRLADELISSVLRELDYNTEAVSAAAFLKNLDEETGITAPIVHQALSTRRVLVMQEINGVTVADQAALAASPVPPDQLAVRLLRSFLDQVMRDGLYHGDPHPGNIFLDADGVLWFLDFGAVGRLDPLILESMQEMVIGFQLRDPVVLARASRKLAGGDETSDSRGLEADIGMALTETMAAGGFDPASMSTMLEIMGRHGMSVPTPMTVLTRALLTLEGTLRVIEPSISVADAVTELLPELADRKQEAVKQQLERELVRSLPALRTLPAHIEGIAAQLRGGRLNMRLERFAGADRAIVGAWVDRVVFAAIGMFGLLSSAVLLVASGLVAEDQDGIRETLLVLGLFGLIITSVIQMRVVAQLIRSESSAERTT
ncbi:AarF/UbiB family protein [soil metagenome]